MLNLQRFFKFNFTSKTGLQSDFNSILINYKDLLKQLSTSTNALSSLANINVKLANSNNEVLLNKISTLNIIDYQKVEITTHDQKVKNY